MKRLLVVLVSLVAVLAVAAPSDAARVRVVTYPGYGHDVHLDSPDGLDATSADFRAFVQRLLTRTWQLGGSDPSCRSASVVTVKRWRSDGFAKGAVSLQEPCPSGGALQIFVRQHGVWKAPHVLGYQDLPSCHVLHRYRVPRTIAPHRCVTGGFHSVVYRGP